MTLDEQLIDGWMINNRINRYLLDAIPREALASASASKGRSVGEMFAHLHNVRLMWLKSAAPDLLEGLEKVEKNNAVAVMSISSTPINANAASILGSRAGASHDALKPGVAVQSK